MTASFLAEDYLEVRDLTVDFDGFKAIEGVDITFAQMSRRCRLCWATQSLYTRKLSKLCSLRSPYTHES